ncbi:ATP-grasp domain-containing protein [Epidermidibacterium keratini]|uniref:ATP-grasp domain-containing protein n=1 Tax=Epidermidibacterium keratini TaxID=1891644 RepID=A0A7L4YKZ4_9ACTN|nr:carboxyl transferase domain-containing protein [Epidermidibacterium keratini]QHB99944.1 ATP-grasp domain-containing protein [Epidermidibacterium keratini]
MRRLLVANRAEIAVRIIDTAAALGIETIAVHPEDDAATAHVTAADRAVLLPGSGVAAYLDIDAIVAAAIETQADAIHPGFGFLSENAEFARRCAEAGIAFVGPSPEALLLFGDKAQARAQAQAAGVPTTRATSGPTTLQQAQDFWDSLGSSAAVMVKALAGGGGRGMAPVRDRADLEPAFARCASEAKAAFGDGSLYVEQLLEDAHHVEVQIVGDGTGAIAVLGDRDCSVQRRRQKLVEIAPAPWIDAGVRRRLHEAAAALMSSAPYAGLATVEFLVSGDDISFLEVNPRIQVEHTVTEQVTGLDLVEIGLRIADGDTLAELDVRSLPDPTRVAVQVRVNSETLSADGTVHPGTGTLTRFAPPTGRGVRVDTHGYAGYQISPRYDSLLAKLIVTEGSFAQAVRRLRRALGEFDVAGVPVNIPLLQAILARSDFADGAIGTAYVDADLAQLIAEADEYAAPGEHPAASEMATVGGSVRTGGEAPPDGASALTAPMQAVVVDIPVAVGDVVAPGSELLVLEAMKMQHVVAADRAGTIRAIAVHVGDVVETGDYVVALEEDPDAEVADEEAGTIDLDEIRPDLAESIERHLYGLDEGRPEVVAKRHAQGRRMARENIADLVDPGSFVEYGALTIAAQRRRRELQDLIERTPADGIVLGTATIDGQPVAVMSYDYTVLAGTQGYQNHRKTDRFLDLAKRQRLPIVMFAEGGGGRPGDSDISHVAQLEVPTFWTLASLAGTVPIVGIVSGYCFAGNAALLGACDVVIATPEASIGMGGPAMIEGGGLGVYHPDEVGPAAMHYRTGVVDILADDEPAAVAAARDVVGVLTGRRTVGKAHDQRLMRHLVPENRLRSYDVAPVIETLADVDSVRELRGGFGVGITTALARLDGVPVGIMANNSHHLGGAIDADAADKATRFLTMCNDHGIAVISLCDTPGFMVGPESEKTATVRRFGAMFVAGARLTPPIFTVVLRKGYGLGAQAMAGGSMHRPALTVAWPTGEFGGMGLEGAVRLGYRKELEAVEDPSQRRELYETLVAQQYERGKALNMATVFEIDDVIDPERTRELLVQAIAISEGPR